MMKIPILYNVKKLDKGTKLIASEDTALKAMAEACLTGIDMND